ncbi:MAG: NAD-dependent epimerase/dehydratase family protein [Bacteroidales bacterium]|jgi:nucleoside-diphosphate-sugar epimerase|nr:NAD-dependent epimerase/dehydratase family protein [Bacteroidales bacterium]
MNILISGIHGFVGTNLVSILKERYTIYGLDIISPERNGIKKTYSWTELDHLPGVNTIIHLAGKAHDTKNKNSSQIYFDINTELTKKIFEYFLQSEAKQFIFFSSIKAAADRVEGDILTEDVVPKPLGPYGESKIAAEKYLHARFSTIDSSQKSVYIFRPCMILGPGNKGNMNLLYNIVSKGIPWPLGAFENRRSFLNIWNLSYIVEAFILKNPPSGIYNLADDEPLSTNELIAHIAASRNKTPHIWHINQSLIKFIARAGTLCKFPLNMERMQKLTENYVVSNQKLKTVLAIDRLPVDVRTGLKHTLETF